MSEEHHVDYHQSLQQTHMEHPLEQQQVLQQQVLDTSMQERTDLMQQQQLQQNQVIMQQTQQYYNAPPSSLPTHYVQELNRYWGEVYSDIEKTKQFKTHKLPLARIKKIMKSDEDVRVRLLKLTFR